MKKRIVKEDDGYSNHENGYYVQETVEEEEEDNAQVPAWSAMPFPVPVPMFYPYMSPGMMPSMMPHNTIPKKKTVTKVLKWVSTADGEWENNY